MYNLRLKKNKAWVLFIILVLFNISLLGITGITKNLVLQKYIVISLKQKN